MIFFVITHFLKYPQKVIQWSSALGKYNSVSLLKISNVRYQILASPRNLTLFNSSSLVKHLQIYPNKNLQNKVWSITKGFEGWRDGSVIKRSCSSFRGIEFHYQHCSQPPLRIQFSFFSSTGTCIHVCACTHTHTF